MFGAASGSERSVSFLGKSFSGKTVHTLQSAFLPFYFIMLAGECSVSSEHFTFTLLCFPVKKAGNAGPDRLCRGGFIELRQLVGVAFLPEGEIGLHAMICAVYIVIQTVLFHHG
jgi:hypothetical protein